MTGPTHQNLAAWRVPDRVLQYAEQGQTKPTRIGPHREILLHGDFQADPVARRQTIQLPQNPKCFQLDIQQAGPERSRIWVLLKIRSLASVAGSFRSQPAGRRPASRRPVPPARTIAPDRQ